MLKLQAYNFILCQKSHFVLYGCETWSLDKWKGHGLGALKKTECKSNSSGRKDDVKGWQKITQRESQFVLFTEYYWRDCSR